MVKKSKTTIILFIFLVISVAFGAGFVGLFIWRYILDAEKINRLKALKACTAPSAPTGVTATPSSSVINTIAVSWTAVAGATGYRVVTVSSEGGAAVIVATTATTVTITVSDPGDYQIWVHTTSNCSDESKSKATTFSAILGTAPPVSIPMLSSPSSVVTVTVAEPNKL